MKHHLIPVRMAFIKRARNNKGWQGHGEKGTVAYCWWECVFVCSHCGNTICQKMKKNKYHTIRQFHLWVHTWENENMNSKRYMNTYVYYSMIYNSQDMEGTQVSIHRWIKKMWYVYTMDYYSAIKKEWNLAICDRDGSKVHYAKRNKSDKHKYRMISLTCRI